MLTEHFIRLIVLCSLHPFYAAYHSLYLHPAVSSIKRLQRAENNQSDEMLSEHETLPTNRVSILLLYFHKHGSE